MTNETNKPNLTALEQRLLDSLQRLVEMNRKEASSCGLDDDEMTWLADARAAIAQAKAKGGAL